MEEPYRVPFTILVDTNESQPFTFDGLIGDADVKYAPLAIHTEWRCLGRYPHSKGDYTIEGFEDRIAIERKAMDDAWGTVLGWETDHQRAHDQPGRRDRFEKELENLAKLDAAIVIVEASFADCLNEMPQFGVKDAKTNAKIFLRSVMAYQQDYRVPWFFCDSRRLAEVIAFRYLERFYWKDLESRKKGSRNVTEADSERGH
jgi:hypothetical protein